MIVRTRFAPSPTGNLHVGSVRTALFSWLYARHHHGQFILRIEDTDQERSTKASIDAILKGMDWLQLSYDEGPYFQTDRYPRYHEVAETLIEKGLAYRCFCSKDHLEQVRQSQLDAKIKPRYDGHCRDKDATNTDKPHVIRFKNPQTGFVAFQDQVYGLIQVNNAELDDLVLIRQDKHPTYNFAVVIDDTDMQITHVIRGDDHINNTPRQINLLQAIEAPLPVYAHLPMILGEDGKRLSKRHGAVSVLDFKQAGILPQALLNYLARLGWSHGDLEIFSRDELINYFDLDHVHRAASCFNYEKLYWLNQHYLRQDKTGSAIEALALQLQDLGLDVKKGPDLGQLLAVQAERYKTIAEIAQNSRYFYEDTIEHDPAALKKHLQPAARAPLTLVHERLQALDNWDPQSLMQVLNQVATDLNLGLGKIGQPLRVAVTGSGSSPAIDLTLAFIGKTRTLARLSQILSDDTASASL